MAPNLETFFAYETAIEAAWQSILRAAGLTVFVEFSDDDKSTPFVEVQLQQTQPTGQRYVYSGVPLFNSWTGILVSRVITVRGKNSDLQTSMLGKVRLQAQKFRDNFSRSVLPYHSIDNLISETGLLRGVDVQERLDWSELSHGITFSIRADAWPGIA